MTNSFPLVAAFAVAVGIGVVVTVKTAAPAVAIAPAPAQFLPPPPPQSFKELAKNSNEERHSREATPPALDLGPEEEVIVTEHPIGLVNKTLKRLNKAQAAARVYAFEEMFIEHPHLDSIDSTLKERTISTRVKSVFVMHATPIPGAETKTVPILLLHGAKFSASTWDQTGTIAALCEAGFHVYAMDLPGYGRSEGKVDSALREVFLKGIIDRLKLSRPIVISPSMSGSFSVPLVLDDPSKLSALVSVAAVRVSKLANVDWSAINVMALHMYGELDTQIGAPGAEWFEPEKDQKPSEQNTAVFKMKGATHACYLDNPKAFNKRLLKFVEKVNGRKRKFKA
eukprot:gene22294-16087_t